MVATESPLRWVFALMLTVMIAMFLFGMVLNPNQFDANLNAVRAEQMQVEIANQAEKNKMDQKKHLALLEAELQEMERTQQRRLAQEAQQAETDRLTLEALKQQQQADLAARQQLHQAELAHQQQAWTDERLSQQRQENLQALLQTVLWAALALSTLILAGALSLVLILLGLERYQNSRPAAKENQLAPNAHLNYEASWSLLQPVVRPQRRAQGRAQQIGGRP